MAAWVACGREYTTPVDENPDNLVTMVLMASQIVGSSPSWQRLDDLSQKRLEELGDHPGAS